MFSFNMLKKEQSEQARLKEILNQFEDGGEKKSESSGNSYSLLCSSEDSFSSEEKSLVKHESIHPGQKTSQIEVIEKRGSRISAEFIQRLNSGSIIKVSDSEFTEKGSA